jgi:hypothetical protein
MRQKNKNFNIERQGGGFKIVLNREEINFGFAQANALIDYLKRNLHFFAHYMEEVKWYIRFIKDENDYIRFDEETGYYRTWFKPGLYKAEEGFLDIFLADASTEIENLDTYTYIVYHRDINYLKRCIKEFYKTIVIPYLEKLFKTDINDIVLMYKAMPPEEKEILERYY